MKRPAAALALAGACMAAAAQAPVLPGTAAGWRAAAMRDITAAYDITLANHAGALAIRRRSRCPCT